MKNLKMVVRFLIIANLMFFPATTLVKAAPQDTFSCTNVTEITQPECEALVAFYQSTNGSSWINTVNWLATNTPSNWTGVAASGGHVIELVLEQNNLTGSLPPEIGNLSELERLMIGYYTCLNHITGSIPSTIGTLTHLTVLNMNCNNFSGSIPSELGDLSQLGSLNLSGSSLSGPIPLELGKLSHLIDLNLNNNQLIGKIPSEFGNLSQLQTLFLNNNHISGSIPKELSNLSHLLHMHLDNNLISGQIPTQLGNLSQLVVVLLNNNQLSGDVPTSITKLINICNFCGGLKIDSNYLNTPASTPELVAFLTTWDPNWLTTQGQPNPVPTLTNLDHTSVIQGSGSFTLTVTGDHFISTAVVNWKGNLLTIHYVSATKLTADVSAALLTTSGTADVSVTNPAPGGGTSSAITITIKVEHKVYLPSLNH